MKSSGRFRLYVDQNIAFADASQAVLMGRLGLSEIVSCDQEIDRGAGVRRIEP